MPRVSVEYRSSSKEVFKRFKHAHPEITIDYNTWANIIYSFNYAFRDYVLETGHICKFPHGFGEFTIKKYKPTKFIEYEGEDKVNLPVDWKKTKENGGKRVFHMNFHTEGFTFRWKWFNKTGRFCFSKLWNFVPSRVSSRLIKHYISIPDGNYADLYQEWTKR